MKIGVSFLLLAAETLVLGGCTREGTGRWKDPEPDRMRPVPVPGEEAPRPERVG